MYNFGWAVCVLCSKYITNLSQESLLFLLTSVLASAVFLLYCIVSYSFFEANHLLHEPFFASINCFIWYPLFFNIFFCFLNFFVNFRKMWFQYVLSFPILSQHVSFVFICLNGVSLFVFRAILCFRRLKVVFYFSETFCVVM